MQPRYVHIFLVNSIGQSFSDAGPPESQLYLHMTMDATQPYTHFPYVKICMMEPYAEGLPPPFELHAKFVCPGCRLM